MEKQTYYVSVASGDILNDKTDSPYEFEIEANEDDIKRLQDLFNHKDKADWGTFVLSHIPIVPYHKLDKENDDYDANMYAIYKLIYELGTPETKREMERQGIVL